MGMVLLCALGFACVLRVCARVRLSVRATTVVWPASAALPHGLTVARATAGCAVSQTPKGQKRKRESWELIYYFGMGGTALLATVGLMYAPETSIKVWAEEESEARRKRLAEAAAAAAASKA